MFLKMLEDTEQYLKITGYLATVIGVVSFIPVVYVVFKTKKTLNFPQKS